MQLSRFIDAQSQIYEQALQEIKSGKKRGHWMWFIFPQINGLGVSSTANFYGIKNYEEAKAYIEDDVLSTRLFEISNTLLSLKGNDASIIFGYPDDLKLKSCMTLFSMVSCNPVFQLVLEKFYKGEKDKKTIDILSKG
ncbi:MAG: DUF1810 domain-containing protein [Oscillospiraceae bacterium]|nr:DUF1810 domain-containing protein [Oscillospiraceae bacterium]